MKIAVPWPFNITSQIRIKEALSLWKNKNLLTLCLVEESNDTFLNEFDTILLPRNSSILGTQSKKCFISDMIEMLVAKHPNEDFYGFGNSDIVPIGCFQETQDYEALVYHRTDIQEWEFRFPDHNQDEIKRLIGTLRFASYSDKRIARMMNIQETPVPEGESEWTYENVRKAMKKQGEIFFRGQDLFLFRRDVVHSILNDYLKPKDFILGTGGFDPRVSRYLMENYNSARILHKIFHKKHVSEWASNEIECIHNGGDIPQSETELYYGHKYLLKLECDCHKPMVPVVMKQFLRKSDPYLYDRLSKV